MRRVAAAILTLLAGTVFPRADGLPVDSLPVVPGAEIVRTGFASLEGWGADDQAAALRAFLKTCPGLRNGSPVPPGLADICHEAVGIGSGLGHSPQVEATRSPPPCGEGLGVGGAPLDDRAEAARPPPGPPLRSGPPSPQGGGQVTDLADTCRRSTGIGSDDARVFFERRFVPLEVRPAGGRGFLTGYYEPEFLGSAMPTPDFAAPLLALPDDLVAARQSADGPKPYPDRAAIEDGALGDHARPLVWLRDAVAVFVVQVQGSARVRLPDGRALRVAYAGRNGHPYTSVARLLVARLGLPPAAMTADRLTEWLRANPEEARDLLRQNRSYVFFRIADELAPADGPVGAAGVPLTAGRSLAVDAAIWPYGLPVWIEGGFSEPPGGRLVVAQDTGAAIAGPARGDLYVGTGDEAGLQAGLIRAGIRFVVLWPKAGGSP